MKDLEASPSYDEKDAESITDTAARRHDRALTLLLAMGLWLVTGTMMGRWWWPTTTTTKVATTHDAGVLEWHIKPIKPHHHGSVEFLTEVTPTGEIVYKRIITAPCGYGMLVFNIGPAQQFEPYAYEIYEDAYAYSNNGGLCVLYPSYKGIQKSDTILWEKDDPTQRTVDLGDAPNKISTRVVHPNNAKNNTKRGGDFLIIRSGNFYDPAYYKHVKDLVHNLPANAANLHLELETILETVAELQALK